MKVIEALATYEDGYTADMEMFHRMNRHDAHKLARFHGYVYASETTYPNDRLDINYVRPYSHDALIVTLRD